MKNVTLSSVKQRILANDSYTRDIDQIVDTHNREQQRKKENKPIWDRKINIKQFLSNEDGTVDTIVNSAHNIAMILQKKLPKDMLDVKSDEYNPEIQDIIDNLESFSIQQLENEEGEPEEILNDVLSQLYDWADYHRVWLG